MPLSTPPDINAPLLDWAQWYASLDWPVFPCNGKTPAIPSVHQPGDPLRGQCHGECGQQGHGLYDATTDPFEIGAWWNKWPKASIGAPSGVKWWALDVDPRAGGDTTLFQLEQQYGSLHRTLLSHTGGGGSHYLWTPLHGLQNKAEIGDGLDVQGAGSYIILPPSVHPDTGNPYGWDIVDGPDDIEPQPAPAWLENLVTQLQRPTRTSQPMVTATIPHGRREKDLLSMAGAMQRTGASQEAIRVALEAQNKLCVHHITGLPDPLPSSALDRMATSIGRYTPEATLEVNTVIQYPQTYNGIPLNGHQAWSTPLPRLDLTDLADMLERSYPLPRWLIKDLIPEGLVYFVGSPKSSKTYLAYSLALSLAYEAQRGGRWLNQYDIVNPGPVVYISLEDDEGDSWWRICELAPWIKTIEPGKFLFKHGFDVPRFSDGLVQILKEQVLETYHPSLIVLDPISYLYDQTKKGSDQFAEIKDMLLPLRWLGKEYHCTVLGVDHRRKKSAEDVDIFETTYGSNAKIAVADAILMVVREDKEITIHTRVRKAGDQTLTLGFEFHSDGTAHWSWKGSVDGLVGSTNYGDIRGKVLTILSGSPIPMSIDDLLFAMSIPISGQSKNSVKQILWRAEKAKEIQKTTRGQYVWAGN